MYNSLGHRNIVFCAVHARVMAGPDCDKDIMKHLVALDIDITEVSKKKFKQRLRNISH
jgi:hypothetical protein